MGKGASIIEGFKIARGDILSFIDADGSTRPLELHKLINQLDTYDCVIASRWLPASNVIVKQSMSRRIASRGFNYLVRFMFGLHFTDTQCGAKVFKKHIIDEIIDSIKVTDFAFDVELLIQLRKRNRRVQEVPTIWVGKNESTINLFKVVPKIFISLLSIRLVNSPFRLLFRK